MANIDIFNLDDSGSELSNNSESFLIDLDDQEQQDIIGGGDAVFFIYNKGNLGIVANSSYFTFNNTTNYQARRREGR